MDFKGTFYTVNMSCMIEEPKKTATLKINDRPL